MTDRRLDLLPLAGGFAGSLGGRLLGFLFLFAGSGRLAPATGRLLARVLLARWLALVGIRSFFSSGIFLPLLKIQQGLGDGGFFLIGQVSLGRPHRLGDLTGRRAPTIAEVTSSRRNAQATANCPIVRPLSRAMELRASWKSRNAFMPSSVCRWLTTG